MARSATPKQLALIAKLTAERPGFAAHLTGADVYSARRFEDGGALDASAASNLIDALFRCPKPAPAADARPARSGRAMSSAQRDYLVKLVNEAGGDPYAALPNGFLAERAFDAMFDPSKFVDSAEASAVIDALRAGAAQAKEAAGPRQALEAKRIYVVGDTVFKSVLSGAGRVYVLRFNPHTASRSKADRWVYASSETDLVAREGQLLTVEQAAEIGHRFGICCCCGADLEDETSVTMGIGPSCFERLAGHRPRKADVEAARAARAGVAC